MNSSEREAMRQALKRRTAELENDPEKARRQLISEGLYDQDGRLTPRYGGRGEDN